MKPLAALLWAGKRVVEKVDDLDYKTVLKVVVLLAEMKDNLMVALKALLMVDLKETRYITDGLLEGDEGFDEGCREGCIIGCDDGERVG